MATREDQDAEDRVSESAYVQAPGHDTRDTATSFAAAVNLETGEGLIDSGIKKAPTAEQIREQRRALCCSVLTLLMSIPALIGG